jgi:hypothetical protein
VSYFRLQKNRKTGPRTVHCFLDSTQRPSQNSGQVSDTTPIRRTHVAVQ